MQRPASGRGGGTGTSTLWTPVYKACLEAVTSTAASPCGLEGATETAKGLATILLGIVVESQVHHNHNHPAVPQCPPSRSQPGDAYKLHHISCGRNSDILQFEDLIPEDKDEKDTADCGVNTLPWPREGDYEGNNLVKTLVNSRQQALAERNYAVHKASKLTEEISSLRRQLESSAALLAEQTNTLTALRLFTPDETTATTTSGGGEPAPQPRPRLPILLMGPLKLHDDAVAKGPGTTPSPCGVTVSCQTNTPWKGAKPAEEEHPGGNEVMRSLENEVKRLRADRDEDHDKKQKELDSLLQELEETRGNLEESNTEWDEKMKELKRLRTIMRFSQLKKDSDRLQSAYRRVDELETSLRKYQMTTQRNERDRTDFRRLRMLDAHCRALYERGGCISEVPVHLIQGASSQQVSNSTKSGDSASLEASSPSAEKPAQAPATAQPVAALPTPNTSPTKQAVPTNTKAVASELPKPKPEVAETDVSFSTITDRMQRYLNKKQTKEKEAAAQAAAAAAAAAKKLSSAPQTNSSHSGLGGLRPSRRPTTASAQRSSHAAGAMRPSSARAVNRQPPVPGAAKSGNASEAARSYSFIGGRLVPFYKR